MNKASSLVLCFECLTQGQMQMQQFQAPGPAGNLMGFPGGWRDGAKGPTSQQKLSRLRSQDQDETVREDACFSVLRPVDQRLAVGWK